MLVIAALMLLCYAFIWLPKEVFFYLIEEDGFFEYTTAIFFLITAVAFFMLFMNDRYLNPSELRSFFSTRARRYVFLLLGLVFFFGFGEEISWGQRIFGFATPEGIAEKNAQNEFNIHNLEIFNVRDNEGQDRGILAKLFTMKQLFLYCFFIFLFVIPWLDRNSAKMNKLFKQLYVPIAPLWLGLLFIGNYIVYRILRIYVDQNYEHKVSDGLTEMQEFNFSIILLVVPFIWMWFNKISPEKT